MSKRRTTDPLGPFVGVVIFLVGVALLGTTFKLALGLFSTDPRDVLHIRSNKPGVDLTEVAGSFAGMLGNVIVLLVMCGVGSAIASRGIQLYSSARSKLAASQKDDSKVD